MSTGFCLSHISVWLLSEHIVTSRDPKKCLCVGAAGQGQAYPHQTVSLTSGTVRKDTVILSTMVQPEDQGSCYSQFLRGGARPQSKELAQSEGRGNKGGKWPKTIFKVFMGMKNKQDK